MTQTCEAETRELDATDAGMMLPFDAIAEPGSYICNWSGYLLRVPEGGVTPGRSPVINVVGPHPLTVTKISGDPYISIARARLIASNLSVQANF